ncbi:MAG: hypothetical protein RLZZ490_2485 [Cyanobacteriota bacterium]|jgi:hypothetical protein
MQISEEITIQVSPKIAQAYQQATEQKKASLSTLISIFLAEESEEEVDFLGKLMDEISDQAVARGLTPEILETILNE